MKDRRPANPELCKHADWLIVQRNYGYRWVTCSECHTDFFPESEAVAAVCRGVESGTIKGKREWFCGFQAGHEDGWFCDPHVPEDQLGPNCGYRLLIPVSDGGSET